MVTLGDRFWSKVDRHTPHGCWDWVAGTTRKGYGTFHLNGKAEYAHRLSLASYSGTTLAKGMHVDHTCFNTSCVNPEHLELVTPGENQRRRSRAAKGNWPGIGGCYWSDDLGLWSAVIVYRDALIHCGHYPVKGRAEAALSSKKRELNLS